jgi:sigma-B regulation protein RsbQ
MSYLPYSKGKKIYSKDSIDLRFSPVLSEADVTKQAVLRRNNVCILGHGKPPLLLCNGFGYNQRMWHYMTTALAVHYQVILFDHVGSGDSDPIAYDIAKYSNLAGYAQDVIEICRVLELTQAFIIGHSVGATIALLVASQAPDYFSKVVLLTPSPCYSNDLDYYGGFERVDLEGILLLLQTDYHGWTSLFVDLLLGPLASSTLGEELHQFFGSTVSQMIHQFARVTFLSDHRADVPHLHLPTLVVQCQQDSIAPLEVGTYLLAHLPNAKLVTLDTVGHCPQLSAPLATLQALQTFLQPQNL